ncbi:hypothetical protein [uncultured Reyranella sp.]|uniref:hypothetical protein n=1 Tax=uncultured Reyranella sp. TaxID=735512 RepID=UPI0025FA92F0|nr:hypothetical protein [uncultured Reyranella sp.]
MSRRREAWAKIKVGLKGLDELGGVVFDWLNDYLPGLLLFVFLGLSVLYYLLG